MTITTVWKRAGGSVPALAVGLSVVLLVSVLVAIGLGPAVVAPAETVRYLWAAVTGGEIGADEVTRYQIVWQIRTPRVLLAAVVGAGLAAVGVVVQALVRNALADPFILGVSSGASVGAVGVSVSGGLAGLGIYAVSAGAFLGALPAQLQGYSPAR
jgi:iron complex transport system permease protein